MSLITRLGEIAPTCQVDCAGLVITESRFSRAVLNKAISQTVPKQVAN
jgi:hypothetical protein